MANKDLRSIALSVIESFCKKKGITKRAFGADYMGDPYFVYELEKGTRDPRMSTLQRAIDAATS